MIPLEHPFGGISFLYPSDWVTDISSDGIILAESQEVLDSSAFSAGAVMLILSGPPDKVGPGGEEAGAEGLLDFVLEGFATAEGQESGEVEPRSFASQEGLGVSLHWSEGGQPLQGYLAAYMDDQVGAIVLAASPEERWDEVWPLFDQMLRSMEFYTPLEAVQQGELELGEVVTATLAPGATDAWSYRSPGDEYVSIDVIAVGEWDPVLEVFNGAGDSMAFDDDSGGEYNPRLSSLYLPVAGTYEFRVSAYSGNGEYQLSLVGAEPPEGGSVNYGEKVQGLLVEGEREVWTFEGSAGDKVTISMVGLEGLTDTYLELYGPDGTLLAFDDDSGGNYSALIGEYELPQSGVYRIVARAYGGETGSYELSLEKEP